jgi:hypothetical protein
MSVAPPFEIVLFRRFPGRRPQNAYPDAALKRSPTFAQSTVFHHASM